MNLQQIRKALSSERNHQGARRAKVQTAVKALGGVRVGRGQVSTKSAAIIRKLKFIKGRGTKNKAARARKVGL